MSFTNNYHTRENYNLAKKRDEKLIEYRFFENSPNGPAHSTFLQGNGLSIAKLPPQFLSNNHIDIESSLKGIGSNNFVDDSFVKNFRPSLKKNTHLHVYQHEPIHIQPIHVLPNQRPF